MLPVGLFGLAMITIRVAGDTAASMASTSAPRFALRHLDHAGAHAVPAMSYMTKPCALMIISVPGPA